MEATLADMAASEAEPAAELARMQRLAATYARLPPGGSLHSCAACTEVSACAAVRGLTSFILHTAAVCGDLCRQKSCRLAAETTPLYLCKCMNQQCCTGQTVDGFKCRPVRHCSAAAAIAHFTHCAWLHQCWRWLTWSWGRSGSARPALSPTRCARMPEILGR